MEAKHQSDGLQWKHTHTHTHSAVYHASLTEIHLAVITLIVALVAQLMRDTHITNNSTWFWLSSECRREGELLWYWLNISTDWLLVSYRHMCTHNDFNQQVCQLAVVSTNNVQSHQSSYTHWRWLSSHSQWVLLTWLLHLCQTATRVKWCWDERGKDWSWEMDERGWR